MRSSGIVQTLGSSGVAWLSAIFIITPICHTNQIGHPQTNNNKHQYPSTSTPSIAHFIQHQLCLKKNIKASSSTDIISRVFFKPMDIDDQLEMLQRELMDVQEEKTNPLSERTVAEIMIKLQTQGFKFYATTDGNQYVTPSQLDQEMIRFVQERGRTKIGILPQIFNLSHDLIESRANPICNATSHVRNGDNLFSADYLKTVILSIKQKLEIEGIVDIDGVALAQELNMQFLMKLVQDNIVELDAEIIGTQLITKQYTRMKKRRILGYLLAISRPINIQTFMKNAKLSDSHPQKLIIQLINEGKLKGKCQNSFYIPDRFSKNQQELIQRFFLNNGYIEFEMLQKNYLVAKPQEWISKNLQGQYTIFQGVCFNKSKLVSYQNQLESLMRGEGFVEISTVIPFDLGEREMEKFLSQLCHLRNFQLHEGICYSEQWLGKCVNQFRDRVIFDIFFKKNDAKGGKKKAGKKEKQKDSKITENDLVQALFDAGLAEYSSAEEMAESLLPLLMRRLETLKTQCQKQLTQSQGVISSVFLKYKKCKSIVKTEQNLQRILNMIEKQKKKSGDWVDADFGPNENDATGKYALIYYDGVLPKDWPELNEELKWADMPFGQIVKSEPVKSKLLSKSLILDFMQILELFNKKVGEKQSIPTPLTAQFVQKLSAPEQEQTAPFTFKFHISDKQHRYVLIDSRMPYLNDMLLTSTGLHSLIEKAYAKLRYCYKAILGVSIQQLILELTGINSQKLTIESEKDEDLLMEQLFAKYLEKGKMVIGVGEGVMDKKIKLNGEDTGLYFMRPYMLEIAPEQEDEGKTILLQPVSIKVQLKAIGKLFRNIYIVEPQQNVMSE